MKIILAAILLFVTATLSGYPPPIYVGVSMIDAQSRFAVDTGSKQYKLIIQKYNTILSDVDIHLDFLSKTGEIVYFSDVVLSLNMDDVGLDMMTVVPFDAIPWGVHEKVVDIKVTVASHVRPPDIEDKGGPLDERICLQDIIDKRRANVGVEKFDVEYAMKLLALPRKDAPPTKSSVEAGPASIEKK